MLFPCARILKIVNSSSVNPQSRSNCSLNSRGNCNLFFSFGVVKLLLISSVVVCLTPYVCIIKRLYKVLTVFVQPVQLAEFFYGFFHVFLRVIGLQGIFSRVRLQAALSFISLTAASKSA